MEDRKKDHIALAFESQLGINQLDNRFYYEPLLAAHPGDIDFQLNVGGKKVRSPFWVSSMTGGTQKAGYINRNLAKACAQYGMGMGLGSCRILLDSPEYFEDFNLRPIIGNDLPLFANIGIAQLENALEEPILSDWLNLLDKLDVDGLIVHVNPLQEWMQPEGDFIKHPPIETIEAALGLYPYPIIVKEVGQGFGLQSIQKLCKLPLEAIDFGANGGTNFTLLELLRADELRAKIFGPVAQIGHSAEEMVDMVNSIADQDSNDIAFDKIIISGGIKHFLDGYYLHEKSILPALIGQASTMLTYALDSFEELDRFLHLQHQGWTLCKSYLTLKK
ncbi:beta/alpha barrel domain-containing protein [Membranihabitans marinus]|uniref:isopentenyl-diphosphate delta-isomerase n=1 Tax=Membranihabitans marinus TaxID=1227546 RepID=UPI001F1F783B|nr:isopentenyl-diphosphate delta-isomerase [Membranihabitans marinus]